VDDATRYRRLLLGTLVALLVGAVLVVLCYLFVDRPVAFAVHARDRLEEFDRVLIDITLVPPIAQALVPAVLAALAIRRAFGPWARWELAVLVGGVTMVLADQFRESISFLAGRYWPETWVDNNPSLIKDGAYGFHPFHSGSAYGSFPSGHTARTAAVGFVLGRVYPRVGWIGGLLVVVMAIALVGMNYHFVSDVIAGAVVGGVVAAWGVALARLEPARVEP